MPGKEVKTLIIGESHTEAVKRALQDQPNESILLVNVKSLPQSPFATKGAVRPGYLKELSFDRVISMIGGNFHNSIGLIESPMPFDFFSPFEAPADASSGRTIIPYHDMLHFFRSAMTSGYLKKISALEQHFSLPTYHIAPPPPIADSTHIALNPGGFFADKVIQGIAPSSLRMKLYRLHGLVLQEFCESERITLILPPPTAVDSGGFLAQKYWKKDPTHANTMYGHLILKQLQDLG